MQFSERAVYLTVSAEDIEDFRMPVVIGCAPSRVHFPARRGRIRVAHAQVCRRLLKETRNICHDAVCG